MKPYYESDGIQIFHGDCRDVLPVNAHAIVTDPPYGLEFMGKGWDKGVPGVEFWEAALGCVPPGGHLLAFGGTRTFHRLAVAIEDAGWEIRDCIQWVYGSGFPKSLDVGKSIDKAAGVEREVVGIAGRSATKTIGTVGHIGGDYMSTSPATPEARQWDGWGTALKPAHEDIIIARKPLTTQGVRGIIVENLTRLEAQLWSILPASVAEKSFGLSPKEFDAVCASALWSADARSSLQDDLCEATDTSRFVSAVTTCLSIVSSWKNTYAESCEQRNTSITSTEIGATIDWKTLRLCSSDLTPRTMLEAAIHQNGYWWNALPAARFLNAAAMSMNATRELSALESAIANGQVKCPEETDLGLKPSNRPIIVARKPLAGTVAATVLAHGTGALNIDGCRVGTESPAPRNAPRKRINGGKFHSGADAPMEMGHYNPTKGRFPANLVHDGSDEVLAGFPETVSGTLQPHHKRGENLNCYGASNQAAPSKDFGGDSGSAARFFYTAKASGEDRGAGNNHPTVKPVALMRWLVRLVTPPGGTVLDPFMGSGSTLVAGRREFVKVVGVDLEEKYCAIARRRLAQRVLAFDEVTP